MAASTAQVSTLGEVVAEFRRHAVLAHTRARIAAEQWARQFAEEVKRNASGPPGPHVVTGQYVDSIFYDVDDQGVDITIDVGSTSPQMHRLEYGFVGTDSLGRQYQQPPFPHWRPAIDALGEIALEETMAKATDFDAV